eukprot:CAMPEP_0118950112 /NCGR_PEP_ID=MMETSP1169-20130426/50790_1 /TAXON_ID=36882 /ORGANISM="Pyramimonas obovata, Strain CCMP722" /LENGTH=176 /DNA_ID=CAMNT_0006896885 /DNA_START=215 /DNA_END=742 /DNA_ORIENTATION=+
MGSKDRVMVSNKRMTVILSVLLVLLVGNIVRKIYDHDVSQVSQVNAAELVAHRPSNCTCPAPEKLVVEPCQHSSDVSPEQISTPDKSDTGHHEIPFPNLSHLKNNIFEPGSLEQPRAEVFKQCFVSPSYYKEHFNHNNHLCAISTSHKLFYYHIPKSGSSSSREIFTKTFNGADYQ